MDYNAFHSSEDAVIVRVIARDGLSEALLSVASGLQDEGRSTDMSMMWVIRDQRTCMQSPDLYPIPDTAETLDYDDLKPSSQRHPRVPLPAELFDEYVIGAADRMKVSLQLLL